MGFPLYSPPLPCGQPRRSHLRALKVVLSLSLLSAWSSVSLFSKSAAASHPFQSCQIIYNGLCIFLSSSPLPIPSQVSMNSVRPEMPSLILLHVPVTSTMLSTVHTLNKGLFNGPLKILLFERGIFLQIPLICGGQKWDSLTFWGRTLVILNYRIDVLNFEVYFISPLTWCKFMLEHSYQIVVISPQHMVTRIILKGSEGGLEPISPFYSVSLRRSKAKIEQGTVPGWCRNG